MSISNRSQAPLAAIVTALVLMLLSAPGQPSSHCSVTAQVRGTATAPQGKGVFFRLSPGEWIALQPAPVEDTRPGDLERFISTAGFSGLQVLRVFKGPGARIRIASPQPRFVIQGLGDATDAVIVKLNVKKDRREAPTFSHNASVTNKGGYRPDDLRRVLVEVLLNDSYAISPESDLKPGEYLLTFGTSETGYDFAITAGNK